MGRPSRSLAILLVTLAACLLTLKVYSWYGWERVRKLTVIYSSDLEGELDPCGCIEGMLGGLARRAAFVATVRDGGYPTLLVDSGGVFFRDAAIPDHMREQLSAKADAIACVYDRMGYDAVNVGDADLALGLDRLRRIAEGSSIPLISAMVAGAEGERAFPPSLIREIGGLDVGIFGIAGEDRGDRTSQAAGRFATARELVAMLRPEVDILICLSHQGLSRDVELAEAVSGIDIIVGGGSGSSLRSPRIEKGTIILQTGEKGRTIGRLDIVLYDDGRPWEDATESERYRRLAIEYDEVVMEQSAVVNSTEDPAKKYDAQRLVERYVRERRLAEERVRDLFGTNHFYNQVIPLGQTFQDDEATLGIIDAYKAKVRLLAQRAEDGASKGPRLYLGAGSCRKCHEIEYDSWMETPHALAYETLEKTDQELDLECIGCHATGYRKEGGFVAPAAVGDLGGVQCEVCHGPGAGHPEEREKLPTAASRDDCIECHTREFDAEFDFHRYRARIGHGARTKPKKQSASR